MSKHFVAGPWLNDLGVLDRFTFSSCRKEAAELTPARKLLVFYSSISRPVNDWRTGILVDVSMGVAGGRSKLRCGHPMAPLQALQLK